MLAAAARHTTAVTASGDVTKPHHTVDRRLRWWASSSTYTDQMRMRMCVGACGVLDAMHLGGGVIRRRQYAFATSCETKHTTFRTTTHSPANLLVDVPTTTPTPPRTPDGITWISSWLKLPVLSRTTSAICRSEGTRRECSVRRVHTARRVHTVQRVHKQARRVHMQVRMTRGCICKDELRPQQAGTGSWLQVMPMNC